MAFMGIVLRTYVLNVTALARLVLVEAALNVFHVLFHCITSLYQINALRHAISTSTNLQHPLHSAYPVTQHAQHALEVYPLSV